MNSSLHQGLSRPAINNLVDQAQVEAYPFDYEEMPRKRADVDLRKRRSRSRTRSPKQARSSDGMPDDDGVDWREFVLKTARQCSEIADTLIDMERTLRVIARQI